MTEILSTLDASCAIENIPTIDGGFGPNNPLFDPIIESFFHTWGFPVDKHTLLKLNCRTIALIGGFAHRSLHSICSSFCRRDLEDVDLMHQVATIICFGDAINHHLLSYDNITGTVQHMPIHPSAHLIVETFFSIYSDIHSVWMTIVEEHLDFLFDKTIASCVYRKVQRNCSKGRSLPSGSLFSASSASLSSRSSYSGREHFQHPRKVQRNRSKGRLSRICLEIHVPITKQEDELSEIDEEDEFSEIDKEDELSEIDEGGELFDADPFQGKTITAEGKREVYNAELDQGVSQEDMNDVFQGDIFDKEGDQEGYKTELDVLENTVTAQCKVTNFVTMSESYKKNTLLQNLAKFGTGTTIPESEKSIENTYFKVFRKPRKKREQYHSVRDIFSKIFRKSRKRGEQHYSMEDTFYKIFRTPRKRGN